MVHRCSAEFFESAPPCDSNSDRFAETNTQFRVNMCAPILIDNGVNTIITNAYIQKTNHKVTFLDKHRHSKSSRIVKELLNRHRILTIFTK